MHYTRPYNRNGKPVSGYNARNPSRTKAKRIALSITINIAIGVGGVFAGATISGSSSGAGADAKPPSLEVSIADFNQTAAVLLASGYKSVNFALESDSNHCAAHSYDLVNGFFQSNSCKWLVRSYLAVHAGNQGLALVAISWVGMPSPSLATKYKLLVDKGGTGNIRELSRDTGPYRSVKFSGDDYASGIIDGSTVWNVQVQPIGSISAAILNNIRNRSKQ